MSECTHDCSTCSANCSSREKSKESMIEKLRDGSKIGKVIAVVSHGCALRSLIANAQGFVITDLGKVGWVRNGGITKIVLADDCLPGVPEFEGLTDHLDQSTMLKGGTFYSRKEDK